jgi:hypothetical protein
VGFCITSWRIFCNLFWKKLVDLRRFVMSLEVLCGNTVISLKLPESKTVHKSSKKFILLQQQQCIPDHVSEQQAYLQCQLFWTCIWLFHNNISVNRYVLKSHVISIHCCGISIYIGQSAPVTKENKQWTI